MAQKKKKSALEYDFLTESAERAEIAGLRETLSGINLIKLFALLVTFNVKLYFHTAALLTIHEEQNGKLPIISLTCLCIRQMQWSK